MQKIKSDRTSRSTPINLEKCGKQNNSLRDIVRFVPVAPEKITVVIKRAEQVATILASPENLNIHRKQGNEAQEKDQKTKDRKVSRR